MTNRASLKSYVEAYRVPGGDRFESTVRRFFADDAVINVCHPFDELKGAEDYLQRFLFPLQEAFENLYRTDYIAMEGAFEDAAWVSCTGYYSGHFARDWLGIRASRTLAYLRFGEFHRMEDGRAVESYVFLDIPELMAATGQWPIADSPGRDRGYVGYLPGPATQDGLRWNPSDTGQSELSLRAVVEMLHGLATEEEAWRPYWHENMVWYGPAAFGSFVGIENFAGFQVPFENAFDEWKGGAAEGGRTRHFTRFGDGNYICSGGWPSLSGFQRSRFLGQPGEGKLLYMRVCDWWRRHDGLLAENWVFVDIPHVLLQMEYDLFGGLAEARQ